MKKSNCLIAGFSGISVLLLFTASCVLLLVYSRQTSDAVREGISLCAHSVIPSLFPMLFLSQFLIKSGAAAQAGRLLDKPVRLLFGLPGVCGVAVLTAFAGGYPAGAKSAEALFSEGVISRKEGERLCNIAFCAGPGFAIGMIGAGLYNEKSLGLLILTAQVISCIIIGIAYNVSGFRDNHSVSRSAIRPVQQIGKADAFVCAVSDSAESMLHMCGFIVLFRVLSSLLDAAGINDLLGRMTGWIGLGAVGMDILPCVSEVTAGSILSVKYGVPFTSFLVGFGGLSVHFQNFAICREIRPRKLVYLTTRIAQGTLCALITSLSLRLPFFSEFSLPTSRTMISGIPTAFSQGTAGFGCALLVMCLMSVICLPRRSGAEGE